MSQPVNKTVLVVNNNGDGWMRVGGVIPLAFGLFCWRWVFIITHQEVREVILAGDDEGHGWKVSVCSPSSLGLGGEILLVLDDLIEGGCSYTHQQVQEVAPTLDNDNGNLEV